MKKQDIYEDLMRIFYQELMENDTFSIKYFDDNYGLSKEHIKVLEELKEDYGM